MKIGGGPKVITPSKVINTWLLFGAWWAPDYVGTDDCGGRQIERARCAWLCFHVRRKSLTPGPLLTWKLGCQRHFFEHHVKINIHTETGGLKSTVRWARGPSWHLCPTTPFASYANAKLYKIKGLFYLFSLRPYERNASINMRIPSAGGGDQSGSSHSSSESLFLFLLWSPCFELLFHIVLWVKKKKKKKRNATWHFPQSGNSSTSSFCHQREGGLALTLKLLEFHTAHGCADIRRPVWWDTAPFNPCHGMLRFHV